MVQAAATVAKAAATTAAVAGVEGRYLQLSILQQLLHPKYWKRLLRQLM